APARQEPLSGRGSGTVSPSPCAGNTSTIRCAPAGSSRPLGCETASRRTAFSAPPRWASSSRRRRPPPHAGMPRPRACPCCGARNNRLEACRRSAGLRAPAWARRAVAAAVPLQSAVAPAPKRKQREPGRRRHGGAYASNLREDAGRLSGRDCPARDVLSGGGELVRPGAGEYTKDDGVALRDGSTRTARVAAKIASRGGG